MTIFPTIDNNTWEYFRLVNSFAPWFSATGTFGAICVSLWLGLRNNFIRLRLTIDRATPMLAAAPTVRISVTNIGTRKANIVRTYVKSGVFRRVKNEPLIHQLRGNPTLPCVLDDGGIMQTDFPMDALALQLKDDFQNTSWWNGGSWMHWFLRTVRVGVVTSTGKSVEVRLRPWKIDGFMGNLRLAKEKI